MSVGAARLAQAAHPAIARLAALTPLDSAALQALERAIAAGAIARPGSELFTEGRPIPAPLLIVEGWAARMRMLPDGRRQFLGFLLPGDLVGMHQYERPLALSTVAAITPVKTCRAPAAHLSPALAQVYGISRAHEEAYLMAQITRVGRLTALESLGDLMLELLERLELAGLAADGSFVLPMTQEMVSDVLGLTPVHVNRMVQQARRLGWLEWRAKRVTIDDPTGLAARVNHMPVKVQAPG
jgi:CRP-like cAMP-binding protein